MFIGELAKQAGLNIESVRFYERKGLLPLAPRSPAGYRCYEQRHLDTIRFIKQSQALGFSLREIRELIEIHERLGAPGKHSPSQDEKLLQLTRERLTTIDDKIRTLKSMRGALANFLRMYQRHKKLVCPAR